MKRFSRLDAKGETWLAPGAAAVHRHGPGQPVKHRICQERKESGWLTAEAVPEGSLRILHQLASGADESAPGDTRENAAAWPRFEAGAKAAADDAFLHPDFARAQLSVGMEASKLGAGSGSARRPVVGPAGAEDEIAAVRVVARSRGGEELDVVDQGAVLAANAPGPKRVMNGGCSLRQPTHVLPHDVARRERSEEEPVAAPGDVSTHGPDTRDLDRARLGETIALDILDCHRAGVDELHADRPDRRLEAMAPWL